jgi:hypothetical protein
MNDHVARLVMSGTKDEVFTAINVMARQTPNKRISEMATLVNTECHKPAADCADCKDETCGFRGMNKDER